MTEVAAALIRKNGRFLICRRPESKKRGGLWEFVGGKLEPHEDGRAALVRECREELGILISAGEVFCEVVHEYPDITVHLTVYEAKIEEGLPRLLEHSAIAWITPADIERFGFCPADESILQRIIKEDTARDTEGY
ncbi:MAG: (deoxy)nucleoside triphosphate pyrophosphohydrolase [Clostridiales bacterium]|nr:(deoxy)nucleoside triphosphate pyrophosphohydrolase [Clostridiales bacterium]